MMVQILFVLRIISLMFLLIVLSLYVVQTKPQTIEKAITNNEDAFQDQVYEGKRLLLIERYNGKIREFRLLPEMVELDKQINKIIDEQTTLRIKILKDLNINEEDFPKWKFDPENKKVIYAGDEKK